LCSHEFAHSIQFAMREQYGSDDPENWYWEASAEWMTELTNPDNNSYTEQTWYYASQTSLTYSTMEGYHQYGMAPFNAFLEEQLTGPDTLRQIWEAADELYVDGWNDVITNVTETATKDLYAGFSGAYGAVTLVDGLLYYPPDHLGSPVDGSSGHVEYLGTDYWLLPTESNITVSGQVILSSDDETGHGVTVPEGGLLAVTGTDPNGSSYTLHMSESDVISKSANDNNGTCGCNSRAISPKLTAPKQILFWMLLPLAVTVTRRNNSTYSGKERL